MLYTFGIGQGPVIAGPCKQNNENSDCIVGKELSAVRETIKLPGKILLCGVRIISL
jgi:hypothetical protein